MNIEQIKILLHKFQIIQKFQFPNISGKSILSFICYKLLHIKYFKMNV